MVSPADEEDRVPARDVHHWIDRWERTGLLDAEEAQALRDDAVRAGAHPGLDTAPDPVDRVLRAARGGVVEALGYVGAVLTIGAAVILLDVPEWPQPALVAVLVVAALVSGAAVWRLTPPREDAARRLAGVLGAAAVAATAAAVAVALGPLETDATPRGWEAAVTVPALAVAVAVYRRHAHLLTHAAMGAAAVGTCVALGQLVVGPGAAFETEQAVAGTLLLVVAVGWVVASETGRLTPAWLGTPAAGAVAYAGSAMSLTWVGGEDAELLAVLAAAVVASALGAVLGRLRVLVVGVVGLAITVPMTFTEVFGWSATATAGLLLPVGVAITVWAVWAGRSPTPR